VNGREEEEDRLPFFAGMVVIIGACGLLAAAFLGKTTPQRMGAFFGVSASLFAGLVALSLKRWALTRSMEFALAMVGASFAVRVVVVMLGWVLVTGRTASIMAYLLGFFGVYFALQWVEISYVVDAQKRNRSGD
jgi:hypothetical protein